MLAYPTVNAIYRRGALELLEPLTLPEGTQIKLILLESVQIGTKEANKQNQRRLVTVPASAFRRLKGLISVGGDALADSEALYDSDSRN